MVKHAQNLSVQAGSLVDELGKPFRIFTKYVKVFDLYFVATPDSPDSKLLHGASVLYQYIDNDDDGLPDNELVYKNLVKMKATMIMFRDEDEYEQNESFFCLNEKCMDISVQDLQADEVCPSSKNPNFFDASLEECFHLVTMGYAEAYPKVFGLEKGSKIADAMDRARGGYFKNVPKKYPSNAWFTYYDKTCDYESMIVEYIYWAMTTILHAQQHREDHIKDEWRLCTKESLEKNDPDVFCLLSNPKYCFPTVCPEKIDAVAMFDPKRHAFELYGAAPLLS